MDERWSESTKIDIARKVLTHLADSLNKMNNVETALRVFGSQSPSNLSDCNDTHLIVPFSKNNSALMEQQLYALDPKGVTPIALSLQKCAGDFPTDPAARNVVILITDGIESCGGDPCSVSLSLLKQNIILKPFIIGMSLTDDDSKLMDCIGTYYNAPDADKFRTIIHNIITNVLEPTTTVVNLLDSEGKPTETDDVMTFYDNATDNYKYNYYHTITYRGTSDTLFIDPLTNYNLEIQTTPPVEKSNVHLLPDQNNVINVKAPQGELYLQLQGGVINNYLNNKIKCLVNRSGEFTDINVQNFNTTQKYLTGKYDLVILTLPRTFIKNIDISQSKTTTIQIPAPGLINIVKSYPYNGGIFIYENNKLKKIYELISDDLRENIGLQPGNYVLVYKPKFSKKTSDTVIKNFTIVSGQVNSIKL
jgi:Ca-activated chloride channel homolog